LFLLLEGGEKKLGGILKGGKGSLSTGMIPKGGKGGKKVHTTASLFCEREGECTSPEANTPFYIGGKGVIYPASSMREKKGGGGLMSNINKKPRIGGEGRGEEYIRYIFSAINILIP